MDEVLVIPGSTAQVSLIRKLQEKNYKVICINPNIEAEGARLADISIKGDILDKEFCLQVAQKYRVKAVLSDECDIAMPTVAYLGEKLHLRTLSVKMAELYTDKSKMRDFCKNNGFLYPEYFVCNDLNEAITFYRENGKIIIKPLDSNSSRGVFTINDESELVSKFEETLRFSKKKKVVLCERYIEGDEFTVDGLVVNGKHYSLAISQKKHYDYNQNIACELFFSSASTEYDYQLLRNINDSFVEKSGLQCGFTHAEYKCENGKYYLIEIGARGGGNHISSHIVPLLTGIDNYDYLIKQSLGVDFFWNVDEIKSGNRCAVLRFFDVNCEGYVEEIQNCDFLSGNENVIMYEFKFRKGDYISKAADDSKRVGFYIAYGENRNELEKTIREIDEKVRIIVR